MKHETAKALNARLKADIAIMERQTLALYRLRAFATNQNLLTKRQLAQEIAIAREGMRNAREIVGWYKNGKKLEAGMTKD